VLQGAAPRLKKRGELCVDMTVVKSFAEPKEEGLAEKKDFLKERMR
jgi:hypothetical protein